MSVDSFKKLWPLRNKRKIWQLDFCNSFPVINSVIPLFVPLIYLSGGGLLGAAGRGGCFCWCENWSTRSLGDTARSPKLTKSRAGPPLVLGFTWTGAATGTGLGRKPHARYCGRIRKNLSQNVDLSNLKSLSSSLHHLIRSAGLSSSPNCH